MLVSSAARLAVVRRSPFLTRAGSSTPGPWGPMNFTGNNWVGNGALPFGFRRRVLWYTCFTTISAVLFAVPFINVELNVWELRVKAWNAAKKANNE
ncbi:hypothetical protein HDV05_001639 [Chytridiales sp. JEL 0842]|nr:hypothetical protein HDV05_001639 [Chytridiales sp. JEL 0842]